METQILNFFVGVAGFEPTTFCSQSRRDTGLRYTPKIFANIRTSLRRFKIFLLSVFRIEEMSFCSLAERGGFEPPVRVTPYDSLANCWFQPLTHLSRWFPNFGTANVVYKSTAANTPGKKIEHFETFLFLHPF